MLGIDILYVIFGHCFQRDSHEHMGLVMITAIATVGLYYNSFICNSN